MANDLYNDNLMFDAEYYLAQNTDVAEAIAEAAAEGVTITAQEHYFLFGAAEGRAPNDWFDIEYYQNTHPSLKGVEANLLLAHFSLFGAKELLAPNPAFADENGLINAVALSEYVNAPTNDDVKKAIAELTGEAVGAELTAAQLSIAAFQFFTYGVTEDREGGIADITPAPVGPKDNTLTEALNEYQEALTTHATNVAEEQAIAKAAVNDLKLDAVADADTKLYDIEEVTKEVEAKIEELEGKVYSIADPSGVIDADAGVNAETVALANELLAGFEKVAQSKVDSLKAQNKAAVSLQEKVTAYDSVAKGINNVAIDYEAAAAKFENVNDSSVIVGDVSNPADAKTFQVTVGLGEDGSVLLSMENGKLVVTGFADASGAQAAVIAKGDLATKQKALEDAQKELAEAKADVAATLPWKAGLTDGDTTLTDAALGDADAASDMLAALETVPADGFTALNALKAKLEADIAAVTAEVPYNNTVTNAEIIAAVAEIKAIEGKVPPLQTAFDEASLAVQALKDALDAGGDDDAVEVYEGLEGVDGFEAAVEALYGNIATQAAAAQAVDAAILNALKSVGYKVYEDEAGIKALSWSKVKIVDGKLVAADDKDTDLVLKALDENGDVKTVAKTGAGLTKDDEYESVELGAVLVALPGIGGDADKPNQIEGEAKIKEQDISNDGKGMPNIIAKPAEESEKAVDELQGAKDKIKDFNKAVDAYFDAVATQEALEQIAEDVEAAAEAVTEAEEAFEDLGFNLVKAVDGVADGEGYDENDADQLVDLFVYGGSKLTIENFDGADKLYFGDKAVDVILVDKAQVENGKLGGDANVLDIFAYQDGANTILFVEDQAFAGNASGAAADNPDLVEITLTGVNAADLSFEDGFITLA